MKQTIYKYFKKELEEATILVRIDPNTFDGLELIVLKNKQVKKTVRTFDETIYEDLKFDEFVNGSPLEFNLHLQNALTHK